MVCVLLMLVCARKHNSRTYCGKSKLFAMLSYSFRYAHLPTYALGYISSVAMSPQGSMLDSGEKLIENNFTVIPVAYFAFSYESMLNKLLRIQCSLFHFLLPVCSHWIAVCSD